MVRHLTKLVKLATDRRGTVAVEYAAVGALIAIAALGAIVGLAGQVKETFENANSSWEESTS